MQSIIFAWSNIVFTKVKFLVTSEASFHPHYALSQSTKTFIVVSIESLSILRKRQPLQVI
jgi:hypothetical protein